MSASLIAIAVGEWSPEGEDGSPPGTGTSAARVPASPPPLCRPGSESWAIPVAAASTSDAVQIRLRSSPVTGAQLVDIYRGVTVVDWDGRRCSVTHDGLEEARWPATPPLSDGSPPDHSDQRPEVGRD